MVSAPQIEMRNLFVLIMLTASTIGASAQWNNCSDARKTMLKAQECGLTYFSQFHLWDVRATNIHSSQYQDKTGEIVLDFLHC